ncbi:DUF6414 family protein [Methanosarcina barkeri]|uniref:Uncharacterized protein n=1 Tax=Methanosarcina barkeri CM1 TaxID=796385 RepID=A0A0G3CBB6_METBA|nr:hypothetical protein [Methanosarcina barkeri]AKJ39291.1 hypothetical protein MCM1_2274 [Methanosarcina barkeri CM1]
MQKAIEDPVDLCIPIYLNQQIVFDLLAIIEDGFTHFSKIKMSSKETGTESSDFGGSFGIKNVFALLDVKLGGEKSKETGNEEKKELTGEKTHTPSSLFAKLRFSLYEKGLIKDIKSEDNFESLKSGDFVEFRAVLKKNPLVDTIEKMKRLMEVASLFVDIPNEGVSKNKRKPTQKKDQNQLIMEQLEALHKDLTKQNSLEIIGKMLDTQEIQAVLSSKINYFIDQNDSEIIDGEFKVLGKVVRIIKTGDEDSINLLRKTSFSMLDTKIFDDFAKKLNDAEESGLKIQEMVAEIKGPAIQIIPISIFT